MRVQQFLSVALFLLLPGPAGGEIASGILAAGTQWETPYHVIEGSQPGPTVFLAGGLHGNEPAGARAAEQIRHWPIGRGKLIVLPKANWTALKAGIRFVPNSSRELRDLNRNFPKTDEKNEAKGALATEIWQLAKQNKPDWLLDLHEGSDFHQINKKSVGSSVIPTKGKGVEEAVTKALAAVNATIDDPKKKLVRLRYPVNGSLARAAHEKLGARSMILETTIKDQPLSKRIIAINARRAYHGP